MKTNLGVCRWVGVMGAGLWLLMAGCGPDDEGTPDPEDRCGIDGFKAFLVGHFDVGGDDVEFRISNEGDTPGMATSNEVRLVVGSFPPPGEDGDLPAILRIYDSGGDRNILARISEMLEDQDEVVATVVDASEIGAGSQGRTNLNDFDCALADGRLCVQYGFDTVGDDTLQDDDEYAFNATGGTVTFLGINSTTRRVDLQLDVELGRNVLRFEDTTTGSLTGCASPRYQLGTDFWPLD